MLGCGSGCGCESADCCFFLLLGGMCWNAPFSLPSRLSASLASSSPPMSLSISIAKSAAFLGNYLRSVERCFFYWLWIKATTTRRSIHREFLFPVRYHVVYCGSFPADALYELYVCVCVDVSGLSSALPVVLASFRHASFHRELWQHHHYLWQARLQKKKVKKWTIFQRWSNRVAASSFPWSSFNWRRLFRFLLLLLPSWKFVDNNKEQSKGAPVDGMQLPVVVVGPVIKWFKGLMSL